ncbi:MAG: HYR domain-containing protein [Saprospiraceae bacterium]|nr:HYR domain-containing protein [Saprospiraceae bacterium]
MLKKFQKFCFLFWFCFLCIRLNGQVANAHYFVKLDHITSYQGNLSCGCREPFDDTEEYTAIVKVNTDTDPAYSSSGCQQCNYNGDCTYGAGVQILEKTDDAKSFSALFHAWEDDGGDRCTYENLYEFLQCPTIFSCPCEVDFETDPYDFRMNSWPSNGTYTTTQTWGDHQYLCTEINHEFALKYTWKYAAGSNVTELDCFASTFEYSGGNLASWCFYLYAETTYEFLNISEGGPDQEDTYMRIYGINGYSIVNSNNNASGSELYSKIVYKPTVSGYYFLELSHNVRLPLLKNGDLYITISNPINNDCINAMNLSTGVSQSYSTLCASQSAPAQSCGGNNEHKDVWFKYKPNASGSIVVGNCALTNYDSRISIYSGSCGSLTPAAPVYCNDNGCGISSSISIPVCKNQTYYISVGGTNGAFGSGKILLTFTPSNTGPGISCPSNTTLNSATDVCGAIHNYSTPNGTDNCPGANTMRTAGLASGSTFPVGTTTNTYKVTDADGATATCSFTVTVLDVTAPTIQCPPYMQITSCEPLEVNYPFPVASDNCLGLGYGIEQINGIPSGNTFPFGTTVNTFRAIDAAGNVSSNCSFLVEVTESGPPSISCPEDFTVQANSPFSNCKAIEVGYAITASSEGCSADVVQLEGLPNGSDLPFFPPTTNVYQITDSEGNTATCGFTITVVDLTKPIISCPSNINVNASGSCDATVTYSTPVASDNCFGPSYPMLTRTSGPASGSVFPLGNTMIIYQATDFSGNSKTCSFTVTVNDGTGPEIDCPDDLEFISLPGVCGHDVEYDEPGYSDNCSGAILEQTAGLVSGAFFPVGNTTVTFRVTDESGLTNTCSFLVSITDEESPAVACPEHVIKYANGSCSGTVGTHLLAAKQDNCTSAGSIAESQSNSGDGNLSGHNDFETVTITATDGSGNTSTCSFTVTLKDTTRPLISCPPNVTLAADANCKATIGNYNLNSKSDNCTVTASISVVQTFSGDGKLSGHNDVETVYLTATDMAGNSNDCAFTVTLKDITPLSLTCPPDITFETGSGSCGPVPKIEVPLGSPVASDNCFIPVVSNTAPANYNLGNTTVKWTATDGLGNSSTCNQKVTVKVGDCGVPVQVLHKDTTDQSAKIQWNAGVPCVTGYQLRLRYELSAGVWSGWTSWANASGPGKEHAFTGLSASTFYQYQIRSKCGPNANSSNINGWFHTKAGGGSIQSKTNFFFGMQNHELFGETAKKNSSDQSYISIVPNPAKETVMFDFIGFEGSQKTLQLIDFSGKVLFTKVLSAEENNYLLDLGELNFRSGLYLVKVQQGLIHSFGKLIVVE